ncbi:hypothetical protein [Ammoniphilus sp. 3BR4]|uniref:hypothetical protein n=1 Tax=Ammoniphilus sp. 3BR4 TaxID=3158265 RepID=UPI0034673BD9
MYVWIYSLLIFIYIVNRLFPTPILSYTVGIFAVIALVISFRKASGLYFRTGLFFLLSGIALFIYFGSPWYHFFLHFESMMGLLSFFLMLPFINTLIHIGHFDTQLNQLLNLKTTNLSQLYMKSSLVSHILGIFLNVATAPLLVKSLSFSLNSLQDGIRNRFYTRSLLRAYALCLTWSPLEVLVSMSIDSTNVKYYDIFPITLLLAFFFILIDWALFKNGKSSDLPIPLKNSTNINISRVKRKILQLMAMLLMFTLVVSLVDHWIGYGFLFSVVLVIVPFSLLVALSLKKVKQYLSITIPHWQQRTQNLYNFFFMFLSAGLFVEMVTQTQWVMQIQAFFAHYADQVLVFYLFIGVYFVFSSLVGFHPLISLALIIEMLNPVFGQLSAIPTALVLISCSLASGMYSPYNISVSLLSSEMKVNPYRITQWNIGFALCYMFISISLAYLIHLIA